MTIPNIELPKEAPREVAAAAGLAFAGYPRLAYAVISDFRRRQAGKEVLRALKEAGYDLSSPSGVALSSLLASGAVSVDDAFAVYLQLKQAEAANLQIAVRMRELELASLQARKAQAQTLRTELQSSKDFADAIYNDTIEAIDAELEAISRQKQELLTADLEQIRTMQAAGVDLRSTLRELETREKALRLARSAIVRKKQRFLFHTTNRLRQGVPTPLTGPEALRKERQMEANLIRLAEEGNKAFRDSELEVDEYFIALAEISAQVDFAGKRRKGMTVQEEVERGKALYKEYVNVLSTYLGPGYAIYFDRAFRKQNGPVLYEHTVDSVDTDEERSFFDTFTKVLLGAAGLGAAGFFLRRRIGRGIQRFLQRGKVPKAPEGPPGPVQDVVEEAKKRASKKLGVPEAPAPKVQKKVQKKRGRRKKK